MQTCPIQTYPIEPQESMFYVSLYVTRITVNGLEITVKGVNLYHGKTHRRDMTRVMTHNL